MDDLDTPAHPPESTARPRAVHGRASGTVTPPAPWLDRVVGKWPGWTSRSADLIGNNSSIDDRVRVPIEYHMRAVRAGVVATFLVLPVLAVYPFMPGVHDVDLVPYAGLIGFALLGALVVALLPWERLFQAGHADRLRYMWSILDIALITWALELTGGPESPLFVLYALTTIFFAASYPLRGQLVLLVFTIAAYLALTPGSGVAVGDVFVRMGVLATIEVLGSFLSHELMGQMGAHRIARAESDRRAHLIASVADAGTQLNVLDPKRVLAAVVDTVARLGFEAADLCVLDDDGVSYRVVEARGLPSEYVGGRHSASHGMVGRVLDVRRTVVVNDYGAFDDGLPELRDLGFGSVLASPVWVQGRLSAVLAAGSKARGEVKPEEIEAFELLAFQAGRAIENAGRFEDEHRMVERLAELDRLKGDFVSTASHELRTPLTVILGMSRTLVTRWEHFDDDQRRDFLQRMHANASSLEEIVSSLLDFSRLEQPQEADTRPLDLGDLVGATAARLAPLFEQHDLNVVVDPDLMVLADSSMLGRVLENLLGNAAKHTPPGTSVTVTAERVGSEAVVAVDDDGPGIANDDQAHLGERFFRGGNPDTRTTRGLGLGLALVRELLELHDSALEVESTPGRGSRFGFRLELEAGRVRPAKELEGRRSGLLDAPRVQSTGS